MEAAELEAQGGQQGAAAAATAAKRSALLSSAAAQLLAAAARAGESPDPVAPTAARRWVRLAARCLQVSLGMNIDDAQAYIQPAVPKTEHTVI